MVNRRLLLNGCEYFKLKSSNAMNLRKLLQSLQQPIRESCIESSGLRLLPNFV